MRILKIAMIAGLIAAAWGTYAIAPAAAAKFSGYEKNGSTLYDPAHDPSYYDEHARNGD